MIPLDPKNVEVERNQMTYLTLRGLPPTSSVRIRIRGVGINKKSAEDTTPVSPDTPLSP